MRTPLTWPYWQHRLHTELFYPGRGTPRLPCVIMHRSLWRMLLGQNQFGIIHCLHIDTLSTFNFHALNFLSICLELLHILHKVLIFQSWSNMINILEMQKNGIPTAFQFLNAHQICLQKSLDNCIWQTKLFKIPQNQNNKPPMSP